MITAVRYFTHWRRRNRTFMLYILLTILLIYWLYIRYLQGLHPSLYTAISSLLISREDDEIYRRITSTSPKPVVFWSNDFHISPIRDLKHLLSPLGVFFFDRSLSGHCHITKTCATWRNLIVINQENGIDLDNSLIPKFYSVYKDDRIMKQVDAFVCSYPTSMCELFEPFNKSLIIIAPTRYELGRSDPIRWKIWNDNLRRYAADPKNVIGANNLYDAEYMKYFTGIKPELLPSFCDYIKDKYKPSRAGYLLAPIHNKNFSSIFHIQYTESCQRINCTVPLRDIRDLYPFYRHSDLAAHQGVVYAPYQVSVMSLFEQYRMNIPLFFPSINLLTRWQLDHMIMNERTWDGVNGERPNGSKIPSDPSQRHRPDPNNERDAWAIRYWIKYSDFYKFPHITYYDSVPDLVKKLENITMEELSSISKAMQEFNALERPNLLNKWRGILERILKYRDKKRDLY